MTPFEVLKRGGHKFPQQILDELHDAGFEVVKLEPFFVYYCPVHEGIGNEDTEVCDYSLHAEECRWERTYRIKDDDG